MHPLNGRPSTVHEREEHTMTNHHKRLAILPILLICTTIATLLIALARTTIPPAHAAATIGDGTPASCSETALDTALNSGGDITFNCGSDPHTITVSSTKTVAADTTITLDGGGLITLSGGDNVRIFAVEQGGTLTLTNLTLTGGNAGSEGGGGALHNTGTTTLNQCSLTSNTANEGGAIMNVNGGTLTINSSSITGNSSTASGGGIFINSGTTTIRTSTISNNTTGASGGGLWYYKWNANQGGALTIENSTIAHNTAAELGGGVSSSGGEGTPQLNLTNTTLAHNTANHSGAIYNGATTTSLTNCTIAHNTATEYVGGVFTSSGAVLNMTNTILANDPDAPGGNCAHEGTFNDGGGNTQFPATSCGETVPTADPLLSDLSDNGGATQTMALGSNSPAIDGGVAEGCPATDQRGEPRPADGNEDGDAICDAGAYELQADEEAPIADNIVGDGTPASCTETALRAAVDRSGTITFNCGSEPHTITVSDEILIEQDTTIDGSGGGDTTQGGLITISGQNQTRIFKLAQQLAFTVKNLTIANGKEPAPDGSGSAIRTGWRDTLTIDNCIFENNDSTAGNQERGGGAIASDSENTITVRNSLFRNNRGANGGAINVVLSGLTVENCTFLDNDSTAGSSSVAHGAGGAIYTDGASAHDGTTAGTIAIRDTVFRGNTSTGEGGAAFTWIYPPDQVIIERSTFDSNTVIPDSRGNALGGGLRHGNGTLTIRDTTFANNLARKQGGGFWTDGHTPATLTNVTFTNNRAMEDDASESGGLGGAIAGAGNFICTNCTIASNQAGSYSGGIYGGENITLQNSIIANNSSNNQWGLRQNCDQSHTDGGGNLQFPAADTSDDKNTNCTASITIADPLLKALADNGGNTQTRAIPADSPAIDMGNDSVCPTSDQRGVARPLDGNGDGTAQCDAGAYEFDPTASGDPGTEPVPLQSVTIEGATEGTVGSRYDFTATVAPQNASTPITYTWQASGHTETSQTSPNISLQWDISGTHTLTVTASNAAEEAVMDTHEIRISQPSSGGDGEGQVFLPLVQR
jgi:hypothetical protein